MKSAIKTTKNLKAYVFDLDGTVVDSKLNFEKMRIDLSFPEGVPILEYLDTLTDPAQIELSNAIIHQHELEGALNSTLMEGYIDLHNYLKKNNFKIGLQTRNSTEVTEITLNKFKLDFDYIITRDDCAPKPKPDGLIKMQKLWNIKPEEMIYIGDFEFDLDTAKNANCLSGLYLWPNNKHLSVKADFSIASYISFIELISLNQID
jgi:HAD superfamily hydrolase (TIGR01549 family)